jgi:hypothetical protein
MECTINHGGISMHTTAATAVALATLFLPALTDATPRDDAKRLCSEVMTQAGPKMAATDVRHICEASTQPPQVWDCAKQRMNQGERFGSALEQCKLARG